MECPVCYNKMSKNSVRLECGHDFCFRCAFQWVPAHYSCPMCRQESTYFSRNTRSHAKAVELMMEVREGLHSCVALGNRFPHLTIPMAAVVIEAHILQQKSLWYRPDMRAIAQLLEDYVNQLFVHCALEPYNEDVKRVFYEFRDFLRG
jgi:hypothetical protein